MNLTLDQLNDQVQDFVTNGQVVSTEDFIIGVHAMSQEIQEIEGFGKDMIINLLFSKEVLHRSKLLFTKALEE